MQECKMVSQPQLDRALSELSDQLKARWED